MPCRRRLVAPLLVLGLMACAPALESQGEPAAEPVPEDDPRHAVPRRDAAVRPLTGGAGAGGAPAGAAGAGGGTAPSVQEPPQQADAGAVLDDGGLPPQVAARDGGARDGKVAPPAVKTGGAAPPCRFHFCDSFEEGADGASPAGWSRNGNIVIDSTRAARGGKALRARNAGINAGNLIARGGVFPPGKTTVYGRVFLWFEKRPQAGGLVHWTLAEVRGGGGPALRALGGISQAAFRGRNNLMFNIDPGGGERSTEDTFPYPIVGEKAWHCLEFTLTRGAKEEARTFWNEEPRSRLTYLGTWGARFKFPSFDTLALGFATYQNVGAFEVWIDELAIDDERIGCEP